MCIIHNVFIIPFSFSVKNMTKVHKVFVSYHHGPDQDYVDKLRSIYGKNRSIIDKSMRMDIGNLKMKTILNKIRTEHLRDSSVTVVLVGEETWSRKWVDLEINSSLRPYGGRTVNGLVGIYLPKYSKKEFRLTDNIQSGYAITINWNEIDEKLMDAIHTAYNWRKSKRRLIDNSRSIREIDGVELPKIDPNKHSKAYENLIGLIELVRAFRRQ